MDKPQSCDSCQFLSMCKVADGFVKSVTDTPMDDTEFGQLMFELVGSWCPYWIPDGAVMTHGNA